MNLYALVDFNLVATHGGFGRAARASGRPKATLSRRVAELEQSLGVRLIERGMQTLRLTEEGLALHARTTELLSEIAEAGEMVSSGASTPRGRMRVSASVVLSQLVLGRIAAQFVQNYPEVQLEIVAEDQQVDLVEEGYDLVLRFNPSTEDRLVGCCLLRDQRVVVAAVSTPIPVLPGSSLEPVAVRATMVTSAPRDTLWHVTVNGESEVTLRPEPILRLSSLLMVRDAVLEGAGAAALPRSLVIEDIEEGRLACWGVLSGPTIELWALYNSRRLITAKVRAFVDHLKFSFQRYAVRVSPASSRRSEN